MQPYEFLTKNQVEQVHDATMQILQEIGIDFRYPPALEVLKKGGAKVDGERVFFPAQLVEALRGYEGVGVEHLALQFMAPRWPDRLEQIEHFAESVLPEF